MLGGKAEIRQKRRFTIVAEPIRRYLENSQRPYSATVQLRTFGIGAQILADLGVKQMRVLSAPVKMHAIQGFGLEVVEYVPCD